MKRRISEIEGSNEIATLALSRTKASIRRLRLEYVILLERLEERAILLPGGIGGFEEMASPPTPSVLDESLNSVGGKLLRNGLAKKGSKKSKPGTSSNADASSVNSRTQKVRDPDLPKRPTNAYLIFCDMEKERIRQEIEEKNPGSTIDLSKSMTEAWKNLDDEDRKPYYKLYEDDRIRYQTEMLAYNKKKQTTDSAEDKRPNKKQKVEKVDDGIVPAIEVSIVKEEEADLTTAEQIEGGQEEQEDYDQDTETIHENRESLAPEESRDVDSQPFDNSEDN